MSANPSHSQAVEGILFVAEDPVPVDVLAEVLEMDRRGVESLLADLAEDYVREARGFVLRDVAGGWRMYSAPAVADYVERFVANGRQARLTQAALETLAVIAYKQPISRQDIGDIRGVASEAAVRTLVARGLVEETGRDGGGGQAHLYGTTSRFLEDAGLRSIDELPPMADFLPEGPAPDEPAAEGYQEARRRVAEASPVRGGRSASADVEDLSTAMDRAAKSALARLRNARAELAVIDVTDEGDASTVGDDAAAVTAGSSAEAEDA